MAAYWCCWHDPSLRPSTRARADHMCGAEHSRRYPWNWTCRRRGRVGSFSQFMQSIGAVSNVQDRSVFNSNDLHKLSAIGILQAVDVPRLAKASIMRT